MRVYVLLDCFEYEESRVVGVLTSKERATSWVEDMMANHVVIPGKYYEYAECELDYLSEKSY